jgi:hypothetical protein
VRVALCPSGCLRHIRRSHDMWHGHLHPLHLLSSSGRETANRTRLFWTISKSRTSNPSFDNPGQVAESRYTESMALKVSLYESQALVFGHVFDHYCLSFTRKRGHRSHGGGCMQLDNVVNGSSSRASKVLETLVRHAVTLV